MRKIGIISLLFLPLLLSTSCQRTGSQAWEDVKTAGRYINRSVDLLCGKNYDRPMIEGEKDFVGPEEEEFIPLSGADLKAEHKMKDIAIAQPSNSLGENGVPVLDQFDIPNGNLNEVFKRIHFTTDDHVVRSREDLIIISNIAKFMKKNASAMLCVEGHCDQRASAAYNMALGTKRANHIRVLLVKQGIDPERIYPVSYGKEKPLAMGDNLEELKMNRRAQFKITERK